MFKPTDSLAIDKQATRDRFLLIDGHALIYRAYHAFPELTDPSGRLVNAVYGFARILLVAVRDFSPKYLAVCFDSKEKTKRAERYEEYKANRPEMPDDLKPQIEIIRQLVEILNIPQFIQPGVEADDLIGCIGSILKNQTSAPLIVVVTGDKDLLQLVTDDLHVFIPARSKTMGDTEYDPENVRRLLGLDPSQVVDYKSLMGDPSDNIPGVKGIGKKTALNLIQKFGTLEKTLVVAKKAQAESTFHAPLTKSVVEKIIAEEEVARLSQSLATIDCSVSIDFNLQACAVSAYDKQLAVEFLKKLGFFSLLKLLPQDEFEQGVQSALF